MTSVFIAGSLSIKNINPYFLSRIDNIINENLPIIIGDADGVDRSIQEYLTYKNYENVTVYYSGNQLRNNIGRWNTEQVLSEFQEGTKKFFTAKDMAMIASASYGLMLWDAKSTGTLKNVIELVSLNKKSTVFINKLAIFQPVRNAEELEKLVSYMADGSIEKANQKINLKSRLIELRNKQVQPNLL
ncbi:hypothetical protein KTG68_14330 [Acinetobacter variabilis]|uniref:hypothetical protein n=1 Tax=Acinetobacter TaxID=469 RepID=UPI0021CDA696|nr:MULTISPECIES: hypothetical protein [Acinetobacter]MCU4313133.1 hypothetical protein [Acinetobacter variabilis]MCU4365288.1 hypothetical protein [Acinetobacter variabilis]MCU4375216.1 hypothetical protein [Acinetobacter variabilis]